MNYDGYSYKIAYGVGAWPWEDVGDSIPTNTLFLVWGNGRTRFGYKDALGQWRGSHHRPMKTVPLKYSPIPKPVKP